MQMNKTSTQIFSVQVRLKKLQLVSCRNQYNWKIIESTLKVCYRCKYCTFFFCTEVSEANKLCASHFVMLSASFFLLLLHTAINSLVYHLTTNCSQSRSPILRAHGLRFPSLSPLSPRRQKAQITSSSCQSSHLVSLWRGDLRERCCKSEPNRTCLIWNIIGWQLQISEILRLYKYDIIFL